jgi:hypothetical protein
MQIGGAVAVLFVGGGIWLLRRREKANNRMAKVDG